MAKTDPSVRPQQKFKFNISRLMARLTIACMALSVRQLHCWRLSLRSDGRNGRDVKPASVIPEHLVKSKLSRLQKYGTTRSLTLLQYPKLRILRSFFCSSLSTTSSSTFRQFDKSISRRHWPGKHKSIIAMALISQLDLILNILRLPPIPIPFTMQENPSFVMWKQFDISTSFGLVPTKLVIAISALSVMMVLNGRRSTLSMSIFLSKSRQRLLTELIFIKSSTDKYEKILIRMVSGNGEVIASADDLLLCVVIALLLVNGIYSSSLIFLFTGGVLGPNDQFGLNISGMGWTLVRSLAVAIISLAISGKLLVKLARNCSLMMIRSQWVTDLTVAVLMIGLFSRQFRNDISPKQLPLDRRATGDSITPFSFNTSTSPSMMKYISPQVSPFRMMYSNGLQTNGSALNANSCMMSGGSTWKMGRFVMKLCTDNGSLFFLSCMANLSCASSLIRRSTAGKCVKTRFSDSAVSTARRIFVLAITVAVLGRLYRIPISPKNSPWLSSAQIVSPSVDVTLTEPLRIQYIDLDGSPVLMMYSFGWNWISFKLAATFLWNAMGALMNRGNVASWSRNIRGMEYDDSSSSQQSVVDTGGDGITVPLRILDFGEDNGDGLQLRRLYDMVVGWQIKEKVVIRK